jgi:hypothetical protein
MGESQLPFKGYHYEGVVMSHKTNGRFPWERDKKMKAAAYYRDFDATRFLPYEEKFSVRLHG